LAAYLAARRLGGVAEANAVAFGTIITTQLGQTLDAGRSEGTLNRSVLGAVAGSAGMLVSSLAVPPLRNLLGLALPGPLGWSLMGAGAVAAVLINRALSVAGSIAPVPQDQAASRDGPQGPPPSPLFLPRP
jgi:hypothetical protein